MMPDKPRRKVYLVLEGRLGRWAALHKSRVASGKVIENAATEIASAVCDLAGWACFEPLVMGRSECLLG